MDCHAERLLSAGASRLVSSALASTSTLTDVPGTFAISGVVDHTNRQAVTTAGTGCAGALDAAHYSPPGATTAQPWTRHRSTPDCPAPTLRCGAERNGIGTFKQPDQRRRAHVLVPVRRRPQARRTRPGRTPLRPGPAGNRAGGGPHVPHPRRAHVRRSTSPTPVGWPPRSARNSRGSGSPSRRTGRTRSSGRGVLGHAACTFMGSAAPRYTALRGDSRRVIRSNSSANGSPTSRPNSVSP